MNRGLIRASIEPNAQDTIVLIFSIAFQFLPALLSMRSSAGPCQTSTGRCTTCQNCQTPGRTTSSDSTRRLRWSSMSVGVLSVPQPRQGALTRVLPASSTRTNQLPHTSTLGTFKMAQGKTKKVKFCLTKTSRSKWLEYCITKYAKRKNLTNFARQLLRYKASGPFKM